MKADLTQERVRELFDYDYENGWLIRKQTRAGIPWNKPCGHKPICNGYGRVCIDGKGYFAHRIIWLWHYGSWPSNQTDHLDRNKINNRIENLRDATGSENEQNKGLKGTNSSGFPGVSWHKRDKKYQAYIKINKKQIHIGCFTAAEEAHLAYQLAKIKYHPTSPIAQEYYRELTLAG